MTWVRTHPWLTIVVVVVAALALLFAISLVLMNVGGETPGDGVGEVITPR